MADANGPQEMVAPHSLGVLQAYLFSVCGTPREVVQLVVLLQVVDWCFGVISSTCLLPIPPRLAELGKWFLHQGALFFSKVFGLHVKSQYWHFSNNKRSLGRQPFFECYQSD